MGPAKPLAIEQQDDRPTRADLSSQIAALSTQITLQNATLQELVKLIKERETGLYDRVASLEARVENLERFQKGCDEEKKVVSGRTWDTTSKVALLVVGAVVAQVIGIIVTALTK